MGYFLAGDIQHIKGLPDSGAGFLRILSFKFDFGGPAETFNVFDGGEKTMPGYFPEAGLFLSQREPEFEAEIVQQHPACIERTREQRQFAFGVKRAFELKTFNRDNFQLDEIDGGFFLRPDPLPDSDVLLDGIPVPCRRLVVVVGKFVRKGNFRSQATESRLEVFNIVDSEPYFAFVWLCHDSILTLHALSSQKNSQASKYANPRFIGFFLDLRTVNLV